MLSRILAILYVLPLFIANSLNAQLLRGSADYAGVTVYEITGIPDSVFLFFSYNTDKYIHALSPNGDSTTFDWEYYDADAEIFQPLTSLYDTKSDILITESRGYRLRITGNGNDYEGRCWALINDFSIEIYNGELIDQEGITIKAIPQSHKWCHLIRDIRARIDSADMYYYNPENGSLFTMELNYPVIRNNWSSNPDAGEADINYFVQNDEHFLEIDIEDPYWEDSWYLLTVTDNYGMTRRDSIFYETIEPHADYAYQYIKLNDSAYYPDRIDRYYDDFYGASYYDNISAPALYLFRNLSVNADTMTWFFGDNLVEQAKDDSVMHTYQLPGTYYPKLIVYNIVDHLYEACTDTFPKSGEVLDTNDYPVEIGESEMTAQANLPNVFSCPEGENNYFRFIGDVSITFFEIAIYNRYGNRIYHFEGDIRDWEGWDGMDHNSKNYVHTGVYYYVVKEIKTLPDFETGRKPRLTANDIADVDKPAPTIYKGFVHVYNTE